VILFESSRHRGVGVAVETSPRRRLRKRKSAEIARARRWVYWYGLVANGVSFRQVADDSGFAVSTIHHATRPESVAWATEVLARAS
jgi:hypothetical protein